MYDYRKDVIELMKNTQNTPASLKQSAIALDLITKLFKNANVSENTERSPIELPISDNAKQTEKDEEEITTDQEQNTDEEEKENNTAQIKFVEKNHDFDDLADDEFRIVRWLNGCIAVDKDNNAVARFSESTVRMEGLENHDIVQLGQVNTERPYIIKVIPDAEPDGIIEFKPAVVERNMFGLVVKKTISNEQLSNYNPMHTMYKISDVLASKFNIKVGDVISLAWKESNPSDVKIRWVYREYDQINTNAIKKTSSGSTPYKPTMKFSLHGQSVALLTADHGVTSNLEKVVTAHNGVPEVIDLKSGSIAKQVTDKFDIVILMQSYIKHAVSIGATEEAKKGDGKVAMAQYSGQLCLEKALYRADNSLNVKDNDAVEYPYVS